MRNSPLLVRGLGERQAVGPARSRARPTDRRTRRPVNASAGSAIATAPMIAAGWRHPNLNVRMPSTNTDTAIPTHSARPSAARVSPASGASTDVSGKNRAGTHTARPPDQRQHPAACGPRQAVAGGDEQRNRGRHDQPPHEPAGRRGPAVEAQDLREVEVGTEGEAERRLVDAAVHVRERPREQQHQRTERRDDRDAERTEHRRARRRRSGSRPRTPAPRPRRVRDRPGRTRRAARASDREAQHPPATACRSAHRAARRAGAGTGATRTASAARVVPARSRCGRRG